MYLRTTKRKNKDGSVVTYYQLAHSLWNPETKQSVTRVIHNFGRADQLERSQLVRLCKSIARVCDIQVTDPLEVSKATASGHSDLSCLPEDLKFVRTLELGAVLTIETLWERLGIGNVLRGVVQESECQLSYERALLAMTANRLCEPESKLGIWDRWLEKVYLPSCQELKLHQMYEAMDLLYEHMDKVEEAIFFQTASLLDLAVDVVFYDTTTVAFSIDAEDEAEDAEDSEALRKYGRSKEGTWNPQVVVALAVTREGLPVRSWVFPGNTTDVETIQRVKADLKGWKLGRALFVGDAGLNSEENRAELAKACGTYLLATRMGSVKEIKEAVLSCPGRYKKLSENLHVKEVVVGGQGVSRRRYILCYNPKEAERQRKHRAELVQMLEAELAKHPSKLATAQWAIQLLASRRIKRYVTITPKGQISINREAIREAAHTDGKWVLQTNDDSLSTADAACGYKALTVIEGCFRTLKRTQLKLNPVYHWLPRRIVAHVKICVMALLIERMAELKCQQSWTHLRHVLGGLQVTEFHTSSHAFFQRNEPSPELMEVLKNLSIPLPTSVLALTPLEKPSQKA